MKRKFLIILACFVLLLTGCSHNPGMKDGFYTAEMSEYSHGWKEYLCIMVWDNAYMQNMYTVNGTYPNEYTRSYVAQLIETQNPDNVDAISGASNSGSNFFKLSNAVIDQAKKGDSTIAVVE